MQPIPVIMTSDVCVDGFGDAGHTATFGYSGKRPNSQPWAVWLELTDEGLHLVVNIALQEDEGDHSDVNNFRYYSRKLEGEGRNSAILQGVGYMNAVADVLRCNQQLNHLDRILQRSWGLRRSV